MRLHLGCVTLDKWCNVSNFEFPQFVITTLWGFCKNEKRRLIYCSIEKYHFFKIKFYFKPYLTHKYHFSRKWESSTRMEWWTCTLKPNRDIPKEGCLQDNGMQDLFIRTTKEKQFPLIHTHDVGHIALQPWGYSSKCTRGSYLCTYFFKGIRNNRIHFLLPSIPWPLALEYT